ncbi:TetR/AcrR family transcriptional regulator [Sporolactobacillus shoreicorticis]|uniref:TetR/AcrR family transcriptional regulator n=1 Tax=Sporolactobacillus shoreicorticis TaxID=1923877 RepID=A0ABW5S5R2_9BACL|nr:TetR/AcrR family transcriptional regulator [Sporolactobacillus shoreicorticis]MCO7125876.1 TetR/AcrR family transcriptional regulator [Sporolactobacillus shoreicorticis]
MRTKVHFEGRRKELLLKIWDLFIKNGYENTTLSVILQRLSLSKGVFYHYFSSKEECADSAIELMVNQCIAELLKEDLHDAEADRKLVHMILGTIHFFHGSRKQEELIDAPENMIFHHKLMVALTKQMAPVYAETIDQGISEGRFHLPRPLETAEMLLTLANFYLDIHLFKWDPKTMPAKVQAFEENMELLLGAQKGMFSFLHSISGEE